MQTAPAVVINTMQYAALADIDAVPQITDTDYAVLNELKAVLERHGALDRFGFHLLHKHFDVAEDERLVEFTDEANRTLTSRVMKTADLPTDGHVIETQWAFDGRGTRHCVGFCHYNFGHARRHNRV